MSEIVEQKTKDRLLKAAVKVFARKGFKSATTREICRRAQANPNAVSYYYGGKEPLYQAVLEFMFEEAEKFKPRPEVLPKATHPPEEQLKLHILTACRVMFGIENEWDEDLAVLFNKEVAHPSPFLDEMIRRYILPEKKAFRAILRGILGSEAPEGVIRDCECSISGQILYYAFAWPLFIRMYPDHPVMKEHIEHLADHVARFSLGGLKAVQKTLKTKKT